MYYYVWIIIIGIIFGLIFKIINWHGEPNFELGINVNIDELLNKAQVLALEHKDSHSKNGTMDINTISSKIYKAFKLISLKINKGYGLLEFEKWLYDNNYLIINVLNETEKNLYNLRGLPFINDRPRIYELISFIITHTDGYIEKDILENVLEKYQKECPLKYYECKNLKLILFYCLLEYVAIISSKSIVINQHINAACSKSFLHNINSRLQYNSFIYGINFCGDSNKINFITKLCQRQGVDFSERLDNFNRQIIRYNILISNTINSIRSVNEYVNLKFILNVSTLHKIFLTENLEIYSKTIDESKAYYLDKLSLIAKSKKLNEIYLARHIVTLANTQNTHIGKLLFKQNNKIFLKSFIYISTVFFLAIGFNATVIYYFMRNIIGIICGLIALPLYISFAITFINKILGITMKHKHLPRLDFSQGIPQNYLTVVTVSQLISNNDELERAVKNLKKLKIVNNFENIRFTLLIDFTSSKSQNSDEDEELLKFARKLFYTELNEKQFNIFWRKRSYSTSENTFMGWERKRGALVRFNSFLLGDNNFEKDFCLVLGDTEYKAKYIITLDSDSYTLQCKELIETISHPQNACYDLLTFQVKTNPITTKQNIFTYVLNNSRGYDVYSSHNFVLGGDVFGQGLYCGKGIYDISAFQKALDGRLPQNKILSHDIIEGAFLRTGESDCVIYETIPPDIKSFLNRSMRWTRGDWQNIGFLTSHVRDEKNKKISNPINLLSKWRILCNIIFSLQYISILILFLLSVFFGTLPFIIAAAFMISEFVLTLYSLIYHSFKIRFSSNLGRAILASFLKTILFFICLPYLAIKTFISIIQSIFRMMISKKNLLKWNTFAHTSSQKIFSFNFWIKETMLCPIVAGLILLISYFTGGVYGLINNLWSIFFLFSAPFAYIYSKGNSKKSILSNNDNKLLQDIAQKTYQFFLEFGLNTPNKLICDNFQEDFNKGTANRTSPTNIGYQILSAICAYDLKIIEYAALYSTLSAITETVSILKKWHGNFYNWYDTDTLKILRPYISTVDNGNLLVALMLATKTLKKKDRLYMRIKRLIDNMDLSMLYDSKKKLFFIGTDTKSFDKIHYDLMASEASLTSFLAIALGKVPLEHWHHLSRTAVKYKGITLFSWSGGMFEYLMPFLFLDADGKTLLNQTCQNSIKAQINYSQKLKCPLWGISESQYYTVDKDNNYQYRAFGVPNISLRNSQNNIRISPYSSSLALGFQPNNAMQNLYKVNALGLCGKYGLYECMDFSEEARVIRTYMAHHQGMVICAINNQLNNNILKKRLLSIPEIDAYKILLYEPPIDFARKKKIYALPKSYEIEPITEIIDQIPILPKYNLLTNGKYHLAIESQGKNISSFNGIILTKDNKNSNTVNLLIDNKIINVMQMSDKCVQNSVYSEYITNYKQIEIHLQIAVMQDCDGEIRHLKIFNNSQDSINIKTAFCIEPVLTFQERYYAHPVFNNMFVVCNKLTENIICANRADDAEPIYLAASLAEGALYECNRFNFHSRNGMGWKNITSEKADSFGEVLEPILSAIKDITIPSQKETNLNFIIVAGKYKDALKEIITRNSAQNSIEKIIETSYIYLKQMWTAFPADSNLMSTVKTIYAKIKTYAIEYDGDIYEAKEDLRQLKIHGIIASRPIISFYYRSENNVQLLKILEVYKYLSGFGLRFTLVLLFSQPEMYINPILDEINQSIDRLSLRAFVADGRILIKNLALIEQDLISIMKKYSQYYYDGVFKNDFEERAYPAKLSIKKSLLYNIHPLNKPNLYMELGLGGFLKDGSYYVNLTSNITPLPWSNIIATKDFGTLITESGGGYTWNENSREKKLTVWQNDVIFDASSEEICIRDEKSKVLWKATKDSQASAEYSIMHKLGESVFECSYNGIYFNNAQFLDIDKNAKIFLISITNTSETDRKISISLKLDISLGVNIYERGDKILFKKEHNKIIGLNATNGVAAFLGTNASNFDYSFSNLDYEYWKNGGEWINISKAEPCMIIKITTNMKIGESKEIYFWLSNKNYENNDIKTTRQKCLNYFNSLSDVIIESPSEELNLIVNRLPYQILCSRFLGRCGYYQAGGAYGFRDQLQDCLAMLYVDAEAVREHILRCSRHQYEEGDVQHWWHPEKKGTRTFITDDLLFLPYVCAEYIKHTADYGILDEITPYLSSPALKQNEKNRYEDPLISKMSDTVYMHCIKAIELAIIRRSHRGLSLIGGGDWNDAFDHVGHKGEGESIWLSMFLYFCINNFLPLVRSSELSTEYKNELIELKKAVENFGWDGEWYRRAYFDNGYPLGSKDSKECKIDILSQAWAIISGLSNSQRAQQALDAVEENLIDNEYRIIKLMNPPIKELDAGYISNYPKGVRENGGQYTHAAIWYALALIMNGQNDKAYKAIDMINPITHCTTSQGIEQYKGEPYIVSADVYSTTQYRGRAGWTYYTGASSWMYKIIIENIFGIKRRGRKLIIEPSLPSSWDKCIVSYRYEGVSIEINIVNKRLKEPVLNIDGRIYYNLNYITLNQSLSKSKIIVEV